jgi:hypothetical protein
MRDESMISPTDGRFQHAQSAVDGCPQGIFLL